MSQVVQTMDKPKLRIARKHLSSKQAVQAPEYRKIEMVKEEMPVVKFYQLLLCWVMFLPLRDALVLLRNKYSVVFNKISGNFDRKAINLRDLIDKKD